MKKFESSSVESNGKSKAAMFCKNADSCWRNDNENKAVEFWKVALKHDSDCTEAHFGLGIAALVSVVNCKSASAALRAITHFNRAIELGMEGEQPHLSLAQVYLIMNPTSEALNVLTRALKIFPNSACIRVGLGACYNKLGNPGPALKWLEEAIAIDPKEALAWAELSLAQLHSRDYRSAIKSGFQAITNGSKDSSVYYNLGLAFRERNEWEKARSSFRLSMKLEKTEDARRQYLYCLGMQIQLN